MVLVLLVFVFVLVKGLVVAVLMRKKELMALLSRKGSPMVVVVEDVDVDDEVLVVANRFLSSKYWKTYRLLSNK